MSPDIENYIVKYLSNAAASNELDKLATWVEKPDNREIFKEYVKIHYSIFYSMKEPDAQEVLDKLHSTIRKEKSFIYKLRSRSVYRYAATIIILVAVAVAYLATNKMKNQNILEENIITHQNNPIAPGTDKAILTLEDGSQVSLEKGKIYSKKNTNSNGEEIIYKEDIANIKEIKYNYLTIPRGGQFAIELSDGTKVWLNSESKIRYPVNFIIGQTRKVELVYGEAFFDVSPSIDNGGSKFIVENQFQEIEVLGTEFNVKAYLGESNTYTTLVEGKVSVSSGNITKNLEPSQQLNLNKENNSSTISEVDVYNEISWKDGIFSFESKTLKEMMVVMSRWYDVEITFKNKAIENEEFIGVLRKNQEIQEILTSIKNFGIIKNFEIYDKNVILE
ncbi:MAG: FecR family protein [Flavobacteriaceae bacterium]